MIESERRSLESFARSLGVAFAWNTSPPTSDSFIIFPGGTRMDPGRTFQEYWDAMQFLILAPLPEQGQRNEETLCELA